MKKNKILHISTPLAWRGGEQQAAYLFDELKSRGFSQCVVCHPGAKILEYCVANNIEYIALAKPKLIGLYFAYQLKKITRAYQPDLIHANDARAHSYAYLAASLFKDPTPIVVSRRVDFPIKQTYLSFKKYNHKSIKKIICVSQAINNIMSQDIKRDNVLETVYDGIDLQKYQQQKQGRLRKEFAIASDIPLIGSVAALAPHKDHFTFLDAVAILKEKKLAAKYFIVGEGALKQQLQEYANAKNLRNDVIFTGQRNDVPYILPELDIFMLTSQTEGLSQVLLEVMASGVPIVATDAGGIKEIVIHEKTGLQSPVKNAQHLAANVLRLLSDKQLSQQLTAFARQFVQQYSKQHTAQQTIAVYNSVINN